MTAYDFYSLSAFKWFRFRVEAIKRDVLIVSTKTLFLLRQAYCIYKHIV